MSLDLDMLEKLAALDRRLEARTAPASEHFAELVAIAKEHEHYVQRFANLLVQLQVRRITAMDLTVNQLIDELRALEAGEAIVEGVGSCVRRPETGTVCLLPEAQE
jgi:hypothetical protein